VRLSDDDPRSLLSFSTATLWSGAAFAGDLFFWHLAIVTTTIANATFFATTAPIWVVLVTWLFFGRRPTGASVAGLALCMIGGSALIAQSLHLSLARAQGDFYGLTTGMFFGLYFIAAQAARRESSAARLTFQATLLTAAILLVVALTLERQFLPGSWRGVAALLAMALISHAGGQGLLSVALGRLPALFSSLVIFLEAIPAAGFAFLLFGEPVTPIQALGGIAILAGIVIARPREGAPPVAVKIGA
jgi:drug/metabolite transporter (DMT)-like permease